MASERTLKISCGNSRFNKRWVEKEVTFDELCERFKIAVRTTETVEEYPKLPKNERDSLKDVGGFIGGSLKNGRRKNSEIVSRSMLTLDADKAKPTLIKDIKNRSPFLRTVCGISC